MSKKSLVCATLEHSTHTILAHHPDDCVGDQCPLHKRSDHCMRMWPQHWRDDRGLMERICPHGVGHPDPDHMAAVRFLDPERAKWEGIHGCDGCCACVEEEP